MWCSPCAPPHVVYSGTLRSSLIPFLSFAFYAHDVCRYSDSVKARLLCTLQAFGWRQDSFLVFRWRSSAGSFPVIIFRGRHSRFFLFLFFSTHFQQNVGRAFSARRPRSALGRGRLTKGGIPAPLSSSTPIGTRGVCMQKVVYLGKVRLTIVPCYLKKKLDTTLNTVENRICCLYRLFREIYIEGVVLWRHQNLSDPKIEYVTGLLQCFRIYRTVEQVVTSGFSMWCCFTSLPIHIYSYYCIWMRKCCFMAQLLVRVIKQSQM